MRTTSHCEATSPSEIDFSRDVRPILANNCFGCHGPDDGHREADLRLDTFATQGESRGASEVIAKGQPEQSELVARITTDDDDLRMPPADSGKSLTQDQIDHLRSWIEQGAEYETHWAFVAPTRSKVPDISDPGWVKNPIDAFVLARLNAEGLRPSPPASPATLLRRLSLDLIGLPPTIEELSEFESRSNAVDDAMADQVERLLRSPHFGEHWGRLWLDAARYADSDGFEKDKPRQVWMYRDWVIRTISDDMPYDQFVIAQIAGDLFPGERQDDIVATGFLRNSMINEEGGVDPEQFRMAAMFDRMDAIGKAILGLTLQCGQCHNHKYDPLTQTDYYRMFALLNNCHEAQVTAYTDEQSRQWESPLDVIRSIESQLQRKHPDWRERMASWERAVREIRPQWTIIHPEFDSSGDQKHFVLEDGSILAQGYAPASTVTEFSIDIDMPRITAIRLELLNDANLPHGGPGRSIFGLCALTEFAASASPRNNPDQQIELEFAEATADVNPPERGLENIFDNKKNERRFTGPVHYAIDGDKLTAWGIDIGPGRSNVPHQAVFGLETPVENSAGWRLHLKLTQGHGGWNSDDNQNNILGCYRLAVTSEPGATADPVPAAVREILSIPSSKRTPQQIQQVFSYWRTTIPDWQDENRRIEALWQSHPHGTSQLVLLERDKPRKTCRLERGDFLQPAEEVTGGVPGFLHPIQGDKSPGRLELARWLVDRRSPTTARAIVNRIWQAYFGTGLVATSEDLGTQGDFPTHPELLDWLAVEMMENGWSLKHLHRLIVNSATYQQSSVVTPQMLERDPANKLLARGARLRVDAEVVRDIALVASGLLNRQVGGPSVYPPAASFLFEPPASYGPKTWDSDEGADKYRRGMYTFRFRSVPYPVLQNFDAPNGDFSCVRRVRSNTPLQALTTLNETLFVECARALAIDTLRAGGNTDSKRVTFVVRRCLSRNPNADELSVLQNFLDQQRERFVDVDHAAEAVQLLAGHGGSQFELLQGTDPSELVAWTALSRILLNLDETISKE